MEKRKEELQKDLDVLFMIGNQINILRSNVDNNVNDGMVIQNVAYIKHLIIKHYKLDESEQVNEIIEKLREVINK